MSFIDKYWLRLSSKQVGTDQFGNKYYISKKKNHTGSDKRYVIYNGIDESSKVPPMWHAWLHYMLDDIPDESDKKLIYKWQKDYLPNLTGTKSAYDPRKVSGDKINNYSKWEPK